MTCKFPAWRVVLMLVTLLWLVFHPATDHGRFTLLCAFTLAGYALFLDWWLELPWLVRLGSLLIQAGVAGTLLARDVVLPLLRPPDEDELALMVEKARPEFRTRLIASLQLARPGGLTPGSSPTLVAALVRETDEAAKAQAGIRDRIRAASLQDIRKNPDLLAFIKG